MKRYLYIFFITLLFCGYTRAQKFSEAIEDNSFLIEEAYNQEDNVIQHISAGYYSRDAKDFLYTFTEEWPFFSQKHQLSFTFAYNSLKSSNSSGIGDLILNYRYQIFDSENWAAVAPRFSVILPTGDEKASLGNGVVGFQFNLPVSKRVSEYVAMHLNAGTTILPGMKTIDSFGKEKKEALTSFNFGMSAILLLNSNFNFMLEYVYNYNNIFNNNGEKEYKGIGILNPGVRYAINIGELQIVPGFAVPISFSDNNSSTDLFFYLSFEHPLKIY